MLSIIDFAAFTQPDSTDQQAIAAEQMRCAQKIDKAVCQFGFFYLTGHGIAPLILERCFRQARLFFDQRRADKEKIHIRNSPCHRGWYDMGEENLNPAENPQGDDKEGLKIGNDLPPDHAFVRAGLPLHGANQWPDLPDWQSDMQAGWLAFCRLGEQLMQAFALNFGQAADFFTPWLQTPMATLSPIRYPPQPADKIAFSAAAHTDFGCLTLLAQDEHRGLQIHTQNGGWLDVPPRDGHLVVNIGDMLARISGGRYQATRHRVINRSGTMRHSLAFFYDPQHDFPLSLSTDDKTAKMARRTEMAETKEAEETKETEEMAAMTEGMETAEGTKTTEESTTMLTKNQTSTALQHLLQKIGASFSYFPLESGAENKDGR